MSEQEREVARIWISKESLIFFFFFRVGFDFFLLYWINKCSYKSRE